MPAPARNRGHRLAAYRQCSADQERKRVDRPGMTGLLRERQAKVAAGIAIVGLLTAGVICLTASVRPGGSLERPEDSKQYLRQMEVYGGRANVLATQAREWFGGLWHGKRLAGTIAVLSLVVAALSFVALTPLAPTGETSEPGAAGTSERTQ